MWLSWISFAFIIAGLVLAYIFLVRPVLLRIPYINKQLATIGAVEITFGRRVSAVLCGLKTKLASWFVILAGFMLSVHDLVLPLLANVDVTPIAAQLPSWAWPMILLALGALFRWLRKVTNGPEAAT